MLAAIKDFLLRERHLGNRRPSTRKRKRNRQRGVALVAVMIAISVTLVITNEFGTSTSVDIQAAANYRDQMRAHFLAHSATNLAELVIRVQQRIDNMSQQKSFSGLSGVRITDFADQALLAFCGTPEEVQQMIGLSPSDAKGLGADIGTCGIRGSITTDDDKLNLNCANASVTVSNQLAAELTTLFSFTAYDPIFTEADADGWLRDRPTQVAAIIDYIDNDFVRLHQGGTTEDYNYEGLKDFYKAKNTYMDTIGEAKLIRGIDDRFWTLFGGSFTVYGGCKVNLGALDNAQLIAGVLAYAAKNPTDPVIEDPQQLFKLANFVAKAKEFGMTFSSSKDFIAFVKDPMTELGVVAGQSSMQGSAAGSALANGTAAAVTNGAKIGLELDPKKLSQITTTGARRTYRVEAYGEIDRKQVMADGKPVFPPVLSTVTGVWDTKVVPQNARKTPAPKGAWVFMKEE